MAAINPRRTGAYLGLGGNLGTPREAMRTALSRLDARADTAVVAVSPLYRTPPWGRLDQPDFVNAVARIETALAPRALLDACLDIEQSLARIRAERWGPRPIDIDILLYGRRRIDEPGLKVPHPRMAERAFVLVPLSALSPGVAIEGESLPVLLSRLDSAEIVQMTVDGSWWRRDVPAQEP